MMSINQTSNPVRNPDIVVRQEADEALLFNPANGDLFCLNHTGVFIWNLCTGDAGEETIALSMEEEYETPSPEKLRLELHDFLGDLKKAGFVGDKYNIEI